MTKERFSPHLVVYGLSLSGPRELQEHFVARIAKRLGPPNAVGELPELPGILFVLWEARSVEESLRNKNFTSGV